MSTDFYWDNNRSDNELWHMPSKVIVAQVFKHEYDPIDQTQTWKMVLPWRETYMVFNKRTNAKAWALSEAKDYAERNYTDTGWKPGTSPEEARAEVRSRLARREAREDLTRLRAEAGK